MNNEISLLARLKKNPLIEKIWLISRHTVTPVYMVGGSLRDLLIKGAFSDLDFTLHDRVEAFVCAVAEALGGTPFSLGSERKSCWRVAVRQDDEMLEMDFTAFKGEDIEADLSRRDFSVNAVALSLSDLFESPSPTCIDPFGGLADLEKRILRPLSEGALVDDPLRIIRGFRLIAFFDLQPEKVFLTYARKHGLLLKKTAAERIRAELFKIFSADRASPTLQLMVDTGVLQIVFPEIIDWEKLDQGAFHKFDLLKHSLKTVQYVEEILHDPTLFSAREREIINRHLDKNVVQGINRRGLLKFSALFHDSGKPATFKRGEGKVSFHGHDEEGAMINREIARRLKMGRRAEKILSNVTQRHMRTLHLSKAEPLTRRAMDRMVRDCGDELIEVLLLALADTLATRDVREVAFTDVEGLVQRVLRRSEELERLPSKPLLSGSEVMAIAGIKEGAQVGKYLKMIEEARLEGEIENRHEAMAFLKKLSRRQN